MSYGNGSSSNASLDVKKMTKIAEASKQTKTLAQAAGGDHATHVAEVVNHGTSITLPINMSIEDGILTLVRRLEYMEKPVILTETLDVFPYDGALALDAVLTERYGWSQATGTPGWFGENPPQLVNVQTGPNTFVRAPWGAFMLPGIEGKITADVDQQGGRFKFKMVAQVKRKDEGTINAIFEATREYLKHNSLYRGKAIKIKFRDDDGDPLAMPQPEFIDTDAIDPEQLILSDAVHDAIDTNLFTPIRRVADCLANGIPVKRGVLLGGTYGTGKTLAASVASRHAADSGVTYLYIPRANELAEAIEFAKQYQSPACVIFCEDVDRVLSGERDEDMDEILNLIDGIDTKNANIIVVVTTNDLNAIEPAMLRPGRLDAVIEVTAPDAKAVEKLLRFYGKDAILSDTNLTEAGILLNGQIPAIIAEVVNRAKLSQLRLNPPGTKVTDLSEAALVDASRTMRAQVQLLADRINPREVPTDTLEGLIGAVVDARTAPVLSDITGTLGTLAKSIKDIKAAVRA